MLLSPLVFCCSLRGFVVFYCAMTQYNTMLCLKTHSAILYKDVTYFRISLFCRIWFVNLILLGFEIIELNMIYEELGLIGYHKLANYIYNIHRFSQM